jgi:hypothetical protein
MMTGILRRTPPLFLGFLWVFWAVFLVLPAPIRAQEPPPAPPEAQEPATEEDKDKEDAPAEEEEPAPEMVLDEGFLVPADEMEPEEEEPPADPFSVFSLSSMDSVAETPVHGSLSLRYRLRWTNDDTDQDLYGLFSFDVGDPETQAVTAHISLRGAVDLDGDRSHSEYYPFYSIEDTFGGSYNWRLYYAYADLHRIPGTGLVRIGRQMVHDTPEFAFVDGARIESEDLTKAAIRFGAYGGLPTHLYESSSKGDFIVGAYGSARPWKGGKVRADWMYVRDETRATIHNNNLFGVALWQNVARNIELHGRYTALESRNRDLLVRGTWYEPDWDLQLRASYYGLLTKQEALALEFDPYTSSLFEYRPYHQESLFLSKGFGDHFVVDGGIDLRQLKDDDDESVYNHEFQRYFLTPTLSDILLEGLSLSVTGELWDSDQNEISTLGLDITQRVDEQWRGSIGTYYSLFKYDYLSQREKDDVRTYYARIEYRYNANWRFHAGYEYEDDDYDNYSTLRVGALWSF